MISRREADPGVPLFGPWGTGSLAAFTLLTTLLSVYGFVAGGLGPR